MNDSFLESTKPLHLPLHRLSKIGRRFLLIWERPMASFLVALAIYSIFSLSKGPLWRESEFPYFNYLADAFLHGQLSLRTVPHRVLDLSFFNGEYFLYWSPMPAILLMPFVALFGVQFSDVAFTLVIAAINVALVAQLLRQARLKRVIKSSRQRRGILVLFFALGTVHITLAPVGRVWLTSQLTAFMFIALAYLSAIKFDGVRAFLLVGLSLTAAMLTRNHLIFVGVWPALYLLHKHRGDNWRRHLPLITTAITPIAIGIGLLGAYNWMRFGSIFDNGISYHLMHRSFLNDYHQYGYFNIHFIPINLFYQYVAYPFPLRPSSTMGGSLFLLSPLFFAAFWAMKKRTRNWSTWVLLATIVLVSIPILLLMGTGFIQFGPRYTLDFTVPLLLLTAIGSQRWKVPVMVVLTLISTAHYFVGTLALMQ
jgi:hypothetical protein